MTLSRNEATNEQPQDTQEVPKEVEQTKVGTAKRVGVSDITVEVRITLQGQEQGQIPIITMANQSPRSSSNWFPEISEKVSAKNKAVRQTGKGKSNKKSTFFARRL